MDFFHKNTEKNYFFTLLFFCENLFHNFYFSFVKVYDLIENQ